MLDTVLIFWRLQNYYFVAMNIIHSVTIITVRVAISVNINSSSSIITLTCIIISISNIVCSKIAPIVPSPARASTTSSLQTVLSAAISSPKFSSLILTEEEATFTSTPVSFLDTADVAFTPKYSSSTVSKATPLTPTSSSSLASLVVLSPTTLSSAVSSASKLLPKPSLSPVSSSPELSPTT